MERSARDFIPNDADLQELKQAARRCKGCPLWKNATQTVFGAGPDSATIFLVGEQPGDREDEKGEPFVGPAGNLLDKALAEAGIPRTEVYLTNAVKHFKWVSSGARRLHARPKRSEVVACRPWLEEELKAVSPEKVCLLGSTAAQSLLGPSFRVTQHRGEPLLDTGIAPIVIATVHPSSILRSRTSEERHQAFADFVKDLTALRNASLHVTA